ncbi:MAG: RidA family protein [Pirellulales bacterium]|nr:RidA family protein [Pirellulales bacterium]
MTWRFFVATIMAGCYAAPAGYTAAQDAVGPSVRYLPLDAPAGMSQAVIVRGVPLVHTRQLLPLDREGKVIGEGSADLQIEQVLNNLEAVLADSGSGMDKLVRINVYALSTATVSGFREHLRHRLEASIRPAITSVLTPLVHRKALVAVDAVAVAADHGTAVALKRCPSVAAVQECADAAVLPRGGVAYLSGQPAEGGLTASAVTRSMSNLMKTLGHLNLLPQHVVQVKVFLRPVTSAEEVLREVRKFFPNQIAPPVVFVEWLAAAPVEIEMIAQLPLSGKPAEPVAYFTPPEFRPSNTFSKAALLQTEQQIYISGLYARVPSRGEPQAVYLFEQLQEILAKAGSDMRHLVKATYYVSDDDAARWIDRTRPRFYDPTRPPAASKVMVHAVGRPGRTLTMDMIAVGCAK